MSSSVRVRFAPSPTGFMHLGNVRAALLNYLLARHHKGTFILRIEDTDQARNLDVAAQKILDDLHWLGLQYDEGPVKGGKYGPYNQSERTDLYQKHLNELITNQKVYRCFCTPEELERKRERQIALKRPPRYDRTCYNLSDEKIKAKLAFGLSFVWRFALNHEQAITINDIAKGSVNFEMHNFADFPLTRADGSFTFMFANFVDDWHMHISHVVRGEDHLSNTALQAALYDAFAVQLPTFWHLPMICNIEGKKLSKRDFGFSLDDLMQGGFIPEAVVNYLATIGSSVEHEIQSLDELVQSYDFTHVHGAAAIKYDIEKLTWFNHQWILKLDSKRLLDLCMPALEDSFSQEQLNAVSNLEQKIMLVRSEMKKIMDVVPLLRCLFEDPEYNRAEIESIVEAARVAEVKKLLLVHQALFDKPDQLLDVLHKELKQNKSLAPALWKTVRYALIGSTSGMNFKDATSLLTIEQVSGRLNKIIA